MFIDTHCHFDFPIFTTDIADSIDKIQQAKIDALIVPAVSANHFHTILHLAEQYNEVYAALGLHPIYQHTESDLEKLSDIINKNPQKLVAMGEIGLDKYNLTVDWQQQLFYFRSQLTLAKKYDLPVLIHSRKTHDIMYHELHQANLPCRGVIHGFSGSYQQAMQFVKLGYYIGVGGVISYARANKTRQTIAQLPLESLVLETDAPDMPLSGRQGQINRPEYLIEIFHVLSQLRKEPQPEILRTILSNTLTLFSRINQKALKH
ncbi:MULTISPECIES: TatD family hydrolase [unclassified Gilliamella]|uniref:TatD family hydrolase n=1 Tax=unclassified Gilliamella TaxID=2685620 RepID=UPI002269F432|nr:MULTISPECIES: TatD family hydrolase [unclassified Gilliamella]MCX8574322.1 TatD family hydrolase [Gilliamella sp. B3831]MCX8576553.1 TatD family hydrolase [Gilliamella sp. B3815]MCX8591054.1 TatD family hydrolase [Gilliamella sp. B3812]MCX8603560.1 TatD family hydrolase [Gilliamella sp. B3823]MCX8605952.1 TatD family hydrolase [Gilliamella sp. B3825]